MFPLELPGRRNAPLMLLVAIFTSVWDGPTKSDIDTGGSRAEEKRGLLKASTALESSSLESSCART